MNNAIDEAILLRAYIESRWPVGAATRMYLSVTGEEYTVLSCPWQDGFPSAMVARMAAQEDFDKYALDKKGTLYWRIVPEIEFSLRHEKYGYYLRLLISDKPVV